MKRTVLIVLALLVISVLAAQGIHGKKQMDCEKHQNGRMERMERGHKGNHGDRMMHIMKQLELTDEQKDKMEDMQIERHKENIAKKAEIETKEVDANVARKNMDFKELKKITNEIFELKKEMKLSQIDHMQNCWNLLSDEQKEKAKELMEMSPRERRMENMDEDEEMKSRKMRKWNKE